MITENDIYQIEEAVESLKELLINPGIKQNESLTSKIEALCNELHYEYVKLSNQQSNNALYAEQERGW